MHRDREPAHAPARGGAHARPLRSRTCAAPGSGTCAASTPIRQSPCELYPGQGIVLAEQIKSDLSEAMRAGERERVGALRLVLSELQKAAKEGSDDELAVLRRERKRRLEAEGAYRDAGREDLATAERAEAELIGSYLPAELSLEDLSALVAQALADTGASSPKDMGMAMKRAMELADGRADSKRVSELVRAALAG